MNLYLVDGYGFVFRAFHSLPPLSSPEGVPVSAVYGFINMIVKVMEQHKADYMAVALDSGGKNHRHKLYSQYKANRTEPDEAIKIQFPIIREAIKALNLSILEEQGVEADDLLATYALQAINHGFDVTIITSDKDLFQLLIYEKIAIYDPIKNKLITRNDVHAKFGVFPEKLTDALALIGDASDNIPGVKGIGPKTAAGLLEKFHSLDALYDNLQDVANPRIRDLLVVHKENAKLSKQLVTLLTDIPINVEIPALKVEAPENSFLISFLAKYGFNSLYHRLKLSDVKDLCATTSTTEFIKISSLEQLNEMVSTLSSNKFIAMHEAESSFTISSEDGKSYIVNTTDAQSDLFSTQSILPYKQAMIALEPLFESESIIKILINSKACLKALLLFEINLKFFEDVAVMAYTLETGRAAYDLASLLQVYCENETEENSLNLLSLYKKLSSKIHLAKKHELYEYIDRPMIKILAAMEMRGIMLDIAVLKMLDLEFKQKAEQLSEEIYKIANLEFNIASPKQLGEVLFVNLGIQGGKKSSKTGVYITDASTLEHLAEQGYNIASLIMQWRHFTKLINTYTSSLPKSINIDTGRVHTTFEMTTTSTGRLSSHSPNLQNIPVRTAEGRKIRKAFIAKKGYSLLSADYSQIELRLLAHIADTKELKRAFNERQDIHAVTASQIFHIPIEEVTPELRYRAKGINFGIIYGISAFGLAKNVDISKQEAALYIDEYFKRYPEIKSYMDHTINFARQHGFVKTLFGRHCYVSGINDKNFTKRSFAERAAINAPLQGSQADIIKKAMVTLPSEIEQYLLLQIHDELLFEVPNDKIEYAKSIVQRTMSGVVKLSLPLEVNLTISQSWGE